MPQFTESKILDYSAAEIYQLVMAIEKYPEFLPWCKLAKIVKVVSNENLQADLIISFKGFLEKYRSNVVHGQKEEGLYFVDVSAIEGPFRKLQNNWKITVIEESKCRVDFFIDFEFSSILLNKVVGLVFEKAVQKMMSAFEERAKAIYNLQ